MDKALETMLNNLPEKTGKTLEEWKKILAKKSFEKHMEAVNHLKSEYGVTHGFANTIVTLSKEENTSNDDLLSNQYQGKENLLPMYKKLISSISKFGKDISIIPKKGSVSLVRSKQFALIKPATKTRIDVGLKLKGKNTTKRLEDSGPFGTMCTHRVQVADIDQVDKQLVAWIKEAYESSK